MSLARNGRAPDTSLWVARVQFNLAPRGPYTVPVSTLRWLQEISETEYKPIRWTPKSTTDFDPKIWYGAKSARGQKPGTKPSTWKVHIAVITETAAEMDLLVNSTKRIPFPPINPQDQLVEVVTATDTDSEDEVPRTLISGNPIAQARDVRRTMDSQRQASQQMQFADYIQSEAMKVVTTLNADGIQASDDEGDEIDSSGPPADAQVVQLIPPAVVSSATTSAASQVEELKKLLAEERRKNEEQQKNFLQAMMTAVCAKVEETVTAKVSQISTGLKDMSTKITTLEERFISSNASSTAASTSSVGDMGERVSLGHNVTMSKFYYDQLEHESCASEWARTLLKGVFGDKAPFMRTKRRKESKENITTFSSYNKHFEVIAQDLLRKWMEAQKQCNENGEWVPKFSRGHIGFKVNGTLKYLAEKSESLLTSEKNNAPGAPKKTRNPTKQKADGAPTNKKRKKYTSWEDETPDEVECVSIPPPASVAAPVPVAPPAPVAPHQPAGQQQQQYHVMGSVRAPSITQWNRAMPNNSTMPNNSNIFPQDGTGVFGTLPGVLSQASDVLNST